MVVALIDCRVRAEEVEVPASVDVPHVHALPLVQHYRDRRIVVRAVPLLPINVLRRRGTGCDAVVAHDLIAQYLYVWGCNLTTTRYC